MRLSDVGCRTRSDNTGYVRPAHRLSGSRVQDSWNPCAFPCGSTKAAVPSPAGQLYLGTYHRLGLRAAAALTGPDSIRILSARHGLLPLHREIAPYDLRLGQPGAVTATTLRQQAGEQGLLDHPDVVLFGGRAYVELARQVWPHARTPLAGTKGIGEQQQRLAGIVSAGHLN